MRSPWKKISSTEKYKNAWIRVREDKVIRPDGKKGIYGVVELGSSAGVVAVTARNEVYLIKEHRYPLQAFTIEIPRGAGPKKEPALHVAKRELMEEAGVTAKNWKSLGFINTSPGIIAEKAQIFLARNIKKTDPKPEGDEYQQVIKLPFSKALSWITSNRINDGITIAALIRAKEYLKIK